MTHTQSSIKVQEQLEGYAIVLFPPPSLVLKKFRKICEKFQKNAMSYHNNHRIKSILTNS